MANKHQKHLIPQDTVVALTCQTAGEGTLPSAVSEFNADRAREQAFERLLTEFTQDEQWRKRSILTTIGILTTSACLVPFLFFIRMAPGDAGSWLIDFQVLMVVGLLAILALTTFGPSRKQSALLEKLASYEDVRAIGPLLWRGLMVNNKAVLQAVVSALTNLLYRVTESDASLLSARNLKSLNGLLSPSVLAIYKKRGDAAWDDLLIALLHAVGEVGNSGALAPVLSLTKAEANTEKQMQIREAAEACLARLRTRAEQGRRPEQLLRASDKPAAQADELLRAAEAKSDTVSHELLRPNEVEKPL